MMGMTGMVGEEMDWGKKEKCESKKEEQED